MNVKIAALADYANISREGKLNIMGIFSEIYGPDFPIYHPGLFLIVQFEFDYNETGAHHLIIEVIDEDGKSYFKREGPIEVPRQDGVLAHTVNLIMEIRDLIFPKQGSYEFKVMTIEPEGGGAPVLLTSVPFAVNKKPSS